MQKVKVVESPELTARFPEAWSTCVRVRLKSGQEVATEVRYPKGHVKDPLSDAEIEQKFRSMFRGYGDERQCQSVLDALWKFDHAANVGDVLKPLVKQS